MGYFGMENLIAELQKSHSRRGSNFAVSPNEYGIPFFVPLHQIQLNYLWDHEN